MTDKLVMKRERYITRDLLESYQRETKDDTRAIHAGYTSPSDGVFSLARTPGFVAICLVAVIVGIAVNPFVGLCAPVLSWIAVYWSRVRRSHRDRMLLERDLPPLLTSIASSVRAGIDPLKALGDANHHFPDESPLKQELSNFRTGLMSGGDEVELIDALCARYQHPDVELFKRCLVLSRTHGSSLAEPLHRVVKVVRQRQSFRRKTRAALAMHRMSAVGIAGCAVLIGMMQMTVNRNGIDIALANPVGLMFLIGGATLVTAGVAWMLSMGREERL
jgi:Flp pilus assembly protein TadB